MPIDPDQVRVDLLKVKRKIFISFPEGSKERNEFMLASKLYELKHLAISDTFGMVLEEYVKGAKSELLTIMMNLCIGVCISAFFFGLHEAHQNNSWYKFWYIPVVVGIIHASRHVYHLVINWQKLKPFKKDHLVLQEKMKNLLAEIRKLTGRE